MYLDFSNEHFKQAALSKTTTNYENGITSVDAFLIVLNGLDFETIDNLCKEVGEELSLDPQVVFTLIQTKDGDSDFNKLVLDTAYELIQDGETIGTKTDGKHNESSWISHSLFEGKLAGEIAEFMGLNYDTAMKIGLLHDIGRKFDHSFMHTIKGFEYLTSLGLIDEAYATLTHSFLSIPKNDVYKGNRCANCDPALEGFYIDENGNGVFEEGSRKDDITTFLENYKYNQYDNILNIADLMATSKGITSPYVRMMDVYTRKTPDPKNIQFFKVCFINSLNRMMYAITQDEEYNKEFNIKDINSYREIDRKLVEVSHIFFIEYIEEIKKDNNKIGLV